MPRPRQDGPTLVYRLFGDADELLYVGCTNDLARRFQLHAGTHDWWASVRRHSSEVFPNRRAAEDRERETIRLEQPRFNIMRYRRPSRDDSVIARPGRPSFLVDRVELRVGVPQALRRRLQALAARRGQSEAVVVRAAIESLLADEP